MSAAVPSVARRTSTAARAAGAALALLIGAAAGAAEGALPEAPVGFSVVPSTVRAGERATVRVEPLRPARSGAADRFDMYIVLFVAWDRVQFLTPAGDWSARPVAYREGLPLPGSAPVVAEWPKPAPLGWLALALVGVRPSATPLDRSNWLFKPVFTMVRVKGAFAGDSRWGRPAVMLGLFALLTVAACALVALYPDRRPPSSGPPAQ